MNAKLIRVLLVSLGALAATGRAEPTQAPIPVQNYWKKLEGLVTAGLVENSSLALRFEPLFWETASGYKGENGWFVGSQVALEGKRTCNVLSIIDSNGNEVFQYPGSSYVKDCTNLPHETTGFREGKFLTIAPGEQLLALSSPSTNPQDPGKVVLYSVTPQQGVLLTDKGAREGVSTDVLSWEGAYYFTDVNKDGRLDVLINRRIRESSGDGAFRYRNQKIVLTIEQGTLRLKNVTEAYRDQLADLCSRVKGDPKVSTIFLQGRMHELPAELGEAIHPEEEQWRKVKYAASAAPDLAADSYLPEGVSAPLAR